MNVEKKRVGTTGQGATSAKRKPLKMPGEFYDLGKLKVSALRENPIPNYLNVN